MVQGEVDAGYEIYRGDDGNLYSYDKSVSPFPTPAQYKTQKGGEQIYTTPTTGERIGDALDNLGTRMLERVKTFGGSLIGDAISGIDSKLAKGISDKTYGLISPMPKEQLNKGHDWVGRVNMANEATTNFMIGELGGAAVGKAVEKVVPYIKETASSIKNATKKGENIIEFKSNIDWGKWNEEIPKNKKLMKVYLDIEKKTKADNAWMKNPDGSDFDGTPEQFIQVNSSNFKKAFSEWDKTYRGMGDDFDHTLKHENPNIGTGVFTGNKELAESYNIGSRGKLLELAHKKSNNVFKFSGIDDDWTDLNLNYNSREVERLTRIKENYEDIINRWKGSKKINSTKTSGKKAYLVNGREVTESDHKEQIALFNKEIKKAEDKLRWISNLTDKEKNMINKLKSTGEGVSTDDIAKFVEDTDLDYAILKQIDDGEVGDVKIINHRKGRFLKSLKHNNGMFDMSNPDIYKSLLPAGIATGVLNSK
jgi:hypothetical protein